MKIFLCTILIFGFSTAQQSENGEECGYHITNKLLGGDLSYLGQHPWIAIIGYQDLELEKLNYACTGSLINPRYVLTSAGCILTKHLRQTGPLTHVRLGDHNIRTELDCFQILDCKPEIKAIDVRIEELIPHPLYNIEGVLSDNIGLIRLAETVDLSAPNTFINTICLPPHGLDTIVTQDYTRLQVTGWDFGNGRPTDVHKSLEMSVAPKEQCHEKFRGFDPLKQICMRTDAVGRRCTGDSGSPLTLLKPLVVLMGVLSHGPIPCGVPFSPAVFTSVSYYIDWIEENMRSYT